ncbi:MAG: hypothetical protein AAGF77_00310 [Bacteroidota bacterium]
MKQESHFMSNRPLADMHGDGVRFDPKVKEAIQKKRAEREMAAKRLPNA